MGDINKNREVSDILREVKSLAVEYHEMTGKPLGVTGEVAEFEAARLLGIELSPARQTGYDGIWKNQKKVQIKGRRIQGTPNSGGRIGAIRLDREWDTVLLVMLDEAYDAVWIREADRADIKAELTRPGSKARNDRGQLGFSQFKRASAQVWP